MAGKEPKEIEETIKKQALKKQAESIDKTWTMEELRKELADVHRDLQEATQAESQATDRLIQRKEALAGTIQQIREAEIQEHETAIRGYEQQLVKIRELEEARLRQIQQSREQFGGAPLHEQAAMKTAAQAFEAEVKTGLTAEEQARQGAATSAVAENRFTEAEARRFEFITKRRMQGRLPVYLQREMRELEAKASRFTRAQKEQTVVEQTARQRRSELQEAEETIAAAEGRPIQVGDVRVDRPPPTREEYEQAVRVRREAMARGLARLPEDQRKQMLAMGAAPVAEAERRRATAAAERAGFGEFPGQREASQEARAERRLGVIDVEGRMGQERQLQRQKQDLLESERAITGAQVIQLLTEQRDAQRKVTEALTSGTSTTAVTISNEIAATIVSQRGDLDAALANTVGPMIKSAMEEQNTYLKDKLQEMWNKVNEQVRAVRRQQGGLGVGA
jgi:hypothetical protein